MKERGYMLKARSQEWETPQWLFDRLNDVFHFTVDLACTEENKKCKIGVTKEESSEILTNKWKGRGWLNPPYGKNLWQWVSNACFCVHGIASFEPTTELIVMLIPSATEIMVWKEYIWQYAQYVIFLYKRLRFEINGKPAGSSTKGSALVVFCRDDIPKIYSLSDIGFIIDLEAQRRLQNGEELITGYEVGDIPLKDYFECGLLPKPEKMEEEKAK
ncbi:MAG TPA: hypothetical protein ENG35_00165 [Desulfobacteraceae bacterium]|nr:hypothetical protein [Desulfobacteraceae bacterium]